ncbi:hypothetical protein AJ80_00874 [Polytolypa hystricis UAMH7299]|uniref:Uncharacterized protein n=1 Tax=Polytolypa hystricis (strain UAMH7299) TaxID=1447883 RepID=A0A2B7Z0E6_POLH7|nr:hypothetical protein AJ80_00874 [Polytolypa hystricis UAMH7299]
MAQANPYILAAENPAALLTLLRANPSIASGQDGHGYSLLHAAASYNQLDLLRALVKEFNVNVNLTDEDGETCLFVVETPEIAQCLIEELGVDRNIKNSDGLLAEESIVNDGSFPAVVAYLQGRTVEAVESNDMLHTAAPLPPNVTLNMSTVTEQANANGAEAEVVDSEFRRRIQELAAKENFHSDEGQRELRALVTDALRDVNAETQEKAMRRRVD